MATVKGSRAPNWGEKEKAMALELIAQEAERGLFSSFRGATKGANEKREAWERVCNSLNASGLVTHQRTIDEVKTMWRKAKGRVKEKVDSSRKTGGGAAEQLTSSEEFLQCHLQSRNPHQLEGIPEGAESVTFCESQDGSKMYTLYVEDGGTTELCEDVLDITDVIQPLEKSTVPEVPVVTSKSACKTFSGSSSLKGKKSLLKLKEEQALTLYTLEEARLRAEIKAFQAQETYYQEKNEREQELHSINIAMLKKQLK